MTDQMKKAPAATGEIRNRSTNYYEGNPMNTSVSQTADKFDARFILSTGSTRVWVQPQDLADGGQVVELTDDYESNLLLSPSEALSVAAALQAVATYLLEEPREIRRKTQPGAPSFEEAI